MERFIREPSLVFSLYGLGIAILFSSRLRLHLISLEFVLAMASEFGEA